MCGVTMTWTWMIMKVFLIIIAKHTSILCQHRRRWSREGRGCWNSFPTRDEILVNFNPMYFSSIVWICSSLQAPKWLVMGIHFSDHCGVTHTNNHRVATQEYFHWTLKEWWRDQSLGEKFAKFANQLEAGAGSRTSIATSCCRFPALLPKTSISTAFTQTSFHRCWAKSTRQKLSSSSIHLLHSSQKYVILKSSIGIISEILNT